jgi:hypothetical protein
VAEGEQPAIGTLAATAAADAAATLRREGAVAVVGVWPREQIERLREAVFAAQPELAGGTALNVKSRTGAGRYYTSVVIGEELLALLGSAELDGMLRDTLGPDYVLEAFGVLMAEPGAARQNVHRDGGILFDGTGLDRLLPAVAVTVAIPLVDVGPANSRTAMLLGTHRQLDGEVSADPVAADLPLGSLLAWEYRTLHFGTEHPGTEPRPLLYLVACRPYWIDNLNFGKNSKPKLLARASVADRLDRRFGRAGIVD